MKLNSMTPFRITFAAATLSGLLLSSISAPAENNPPESTNQVAAQFAANEAAAKTGDPKALFELSRAYSHGLGVERDTAKAVDYARQAAEKGYPPAETELGSFYGRGLGVSKDVVEAVSWYRKAADQGFALAQSAIGTFYLSGKGVPKNVDLAIQWFKQAAAQDNAAAECQLGLLYFNGVKGDTNHPVDYAEAVKWLKKAADQGYVGAMNNLGYAYNNGLGGLPFDPKTGSKWLLQAAEKGNDKAQASLGEMYRTGRGVPKDQVQAYVWLSLAQAGGNLDGRHSAPEVAALLTPAELQKAEEMIQYFQTHHPVGEASAQAAK
jgi:TPR repeat protein